MRLLTLSVLLAASSTAGAVPALIPHEGRLLRADGSPERGSHSLTFALYTQATGGTAVWTETHSVTLSTGGYYAAQLGEILPLPALAAPGYWLGVTVQGEAEMLPRARLASVPFALRSGLAEDALRLGGDASATILRKSDAMEILHVEDSRLLYAPPDFTCTAGNWCRAPAQWGQNRLSTNGRYTECLGDANCSGNYIELVLDVNQHRSVFFSHLDWISSRVITVLVSYDGGTTFTFHKSINTHRGQDGAVYSSSIRTAITNLPLGADVRVRLVASKGRMHFEGMGLSKMIFPEADGQPYRSVARRSQTGPSDGTCNVDTTCNLPVPTRVVTLVKTQSSTAVRVHYVDNMRSYGADNVARACDWAIRFNGAACPSGDIFGTVYSYYDDPHRPRPVAGYCSGLAAGTYTVQVYVRNNTNYGRASCYTGWPDQHWMLEAEEVQ